MILKDFIAQAHALAVEKGWWERKAETPEQLTDEVGRQIANFHSEISEAWDEFVHGHGLTEIRYEPPKEEGSLPKPLGFPIELADVIIRICDTAGRYGIDLEKAIQIKHEYNKSRSYRHGGKKA